MKLFFITFLTIAASLLAAGQDRPHFVIYLSDDHSAYDTSFSGLSEIETPEMEKLAEAGMRFTHAHVASPTCAPSRAALLTGLMPARNGAEANHTFPREDIPSLIDSLNEAGYFTAAVGKVAHGKVAASFGFQHISNARSHSAIKEDVIDLLDSHDSEIPLALFVGTSNPHVPWPMQNEVDPAAAVVPPIHLDTPQTRLERAAYTQEILDLDTLLGELRAITEQHLGQDHVFLHSSDHGSQWPFGKWNLYDYGTEVPLLVSWPGKVKAGSISDALVSWVDIIPTLLDLGGAEIPSNLDGRSFAEVLTGKTDTHRELIFTTHSGDGNKNIFPIRAVSDGNWKLIHNLRPDLSHTNHSDLLRRRGAGTYWTEWTRAARNDETARRIVDRYFERPEFEFYNLADDPWETRNLIDEADQQEKIEALRSALTDWRATQGDDSEIFDEPRPLADRKTWSPESWGQRGLVTPANKGPHRSRPNIILVFIDDMGWGDFSCFGNDDAETPNIDRLASEGIRFEQFYVNSPICSPSRVAISTGQYPQRWRITSFLNNRKSNEERGMAQWLDPSAPMLARSLQESGYATGHFGKWHMGGQRDVNNAPPITAYGFDTSLTNFEGMGPKLLPLTLRPGEEEPGRIWERAEILGEGYRWMQRSEITKGFVDEALPFIDEAVAAKKPFYLNLWPDDVHGPFWPPVAEWGDGSKRTLYLAVLEAMDAQLGKLFDRIESDPDLRDNTLILACSDNGPEPGAGEAGPFRGYKTHLYEGGIRSSLVAWGPGILHTQGLVDTDSVFSAIDLVPTLLDVTGTRHAKGIEYDGESLIGTLLGNGGSRGAPIFFRRPPDRDSFYDVEDLPDLAVRSGKWKLMCEYDGSQAELYDLEQDRGETTNLAEANPEITADFIAKVLAWNEEMPQDNGATYRPTPRNPKGKGPKK